MAKISKDLSAGTLHPRELLYLAGTLGSAGAEIIIPADGSASIALDLRGTFNLSVEVSGTVDGTNWTPIPVRPVNQASVAYVPAVAGSAAGLWVGSALGFKQVKARCTAYTSGAAAAVISATNAPLDQSLSGTSITANTATGASGAAVTLTIANPGAGLRNYLTFVEITRFAAAVLTAAAAPVVVNSSNLPNALAWSLPADAAALGTQFVLREDFNYPLASSAQGAATTIIAPLTAGVIWRLSAGYFVAP
jgi:hypothetical protein